MNIDALRRQIRGQMPDFIADLREKARNRAENAPNREAGYSIRNAAGDEAVVRIYDEIWWLGVNAEDLSRDLDNITAPRIRVEINSPGGDVFDGIAIYNALRLHPAHVTTRVDGLAASIASVIAQAGDHRVIVASAQMMIHNAWGMAIGDHADHAEMSALLQQQDDVIAGIYASRSGKDADHFRSLMDAETWLTDERAVAEGLADEIFIPERSAQDKAPTLNQQIAEAVDAVEAAISGAERVVALRAEAGKTLSVVNLEGLAGLRNAIDRIDGLTATEADDPVDLELAERRIAARKRDNDYRASLPAHLV